MAEHSPLGSALNLKNFQSLRPSLFVMEAELAGMKRFVMGVHVGR
jgi:hypothetical protein